MQNNNENCYVLIDLSFLNKNKKNLLNNRTSSDRNRNKCIYRIFYWLSRYFVFTLDFCVFVVTAELGDYEDGVHTAGDISEFRFVEEQTEEMELAILEKFKTCKSVAQRLCFIDS